MSLTSIGTRLHTSLRPGLAVGNKQGVGPLAAQFGVRKPQASAAVAKATATNSAPVTLSEAQSHSRWLRSDQLMAAAKADPAYARQMAEAFALRPDEMAMNVTDTPPRGTDTFTAWANQSLAFDKEAAPVNAQRIQLYSSLKASGKADVDILQAILNFNATRPIDYQRKTGFWQLDTKA